MKEIAYLSLDNILSFHDFVLLQTPLEDKGLSKDTSIESALHRIDDHIYYDGITNIFDIAALYGEAIARGHCFNNGNKRTALMSVIAFLLINEMRLNVPNDRASDMIVLVAMNLVTWQEFSLWLKFHCKYKPIEQIVEQ